jgi:hypothetical protein
MIVKIRNWEKFQHYKDRCPPWIKLHYTMLSSKDWVMMTDSERVLAIACMLIASQSELGSGRFEADPEYIKRVAYLHKTPDLQPLINQGFLEVIDNGASTCKQMQAKATTETEAEAETEAEERQTLGQQADPFDLFWDAYPRKVKKQDARNVWKSRKLDKLLDDIIDDVTTRRQTDGEWKRGFIPHPTTYLRGERWQDEIEVAESAVDRATREALEWRDNHGSF